MWCEARIQATGPCREGRHFGVGGCTNIAGDVVTGAAIESADHPYIYGEVPCYTVEGVPYYTPPGDPC